MPKYIELEKAIDLFYPVDPENDGSDGGTTILKSSNYTSAEIESMLSDLPVVDVVSVVRGKWEPGNHICPVCGNDKFKGLDADIWADWKPPFCPNCGATMNQEDQI